MTKDGKHGPILSLRSSLLWTVTVFVYCPQPLIGGCPEWRSVKPNIILFHNYWRFHPPIDEITSKGSSCSLFATRAESYNSYVPSCRCERFLRINSLTDHHSWLSPFYLIFSLFFGFTCALISRFIAA